MFWNIGNEWLFVKTKNTVTIEVREKEFISVVYALQVHMNSYLLLLFWLLGYIYLLIYFSEGRKTYSKLSPGVNF